ncbi:MAG TPA: hypothetical protein VGK53_12530 [Propionicimonas sp.]
MTSQDPTRFDNVIAEFWIDESASGLLTKQLLKVSLGPETAIAAQRMVDELSAGF